MIKKGEDNVISIGDEIILKYDKEEYKFNIIETNEQTTILGQEIIKTNIDEYIKNLQDKGFKSIIGGELSEESKPIINIKTENLK